MFFSDKLYFLNKYFNLHDLGKAVDISGMGGGALMTPTHIKNLKSKAKFELKL